MVTPIALKTRKDNNIDIGIARPTNNAFRVPKKNNKTSTTKITPEIILFSKFATDDLV